MNELNRDFATDKQRALLRGLAARQGLTAPTSSQLTALSKFDVSDVVRRLDSGIDVFGDGNKPFDAVPIPSTTTGETTSFTETNSDELLDVMTELLRVAMEIRDHLIPPTE